MEILKATDNTSIHYISLGAGDTTLVFLHGWTASVREWLPFASELSEKHGVICWDARGHGKHAYATDTEMTLPRMADDLNELLNHLDVHDVVLIGHSMGALTAWEYIRRHGQKRLKGLCIIDQSPKLVVDVQWKHGVYGNLDETKNKHLIQRFTTDFAEGVLELIAFGNNRRSRENYDSNSRGFQQMRDYLKTLPGTLLTRCWVSITQQDYRDVLPQIHCPTLLIYGDESQFYNQDVQQWVAEAIADSELYIYPDSDHSPHLWHKERFIYDLNRFVEAL
ncbi:alpha/beta fold hydrolase [Neptunomonas antarctica]|uniref:Pimeloyl-ACP methyl ester carboxylesterase n=1 Tax=Neptunomonas antarctica TaxID=619304 RepID=A0A1N7LM09_9GAMM|nr:alpha/beta hydrolase [Neptunomonas antarctica]SIS74847.1 Pimeloyl-ACP methyl ester carboxylesterase [Neptunomonas antarctica]